MAMEMHELQRTGHRGGQRTRPAQHDGLTELAKEIAGQTDVPADVKADLEALQQGP